MASYLLKFPTDHNGAAAIWVERIAGLAPKYHIRTRQTRARRERIARYGIGIVAAQDIIEKAISDGRLRVRQYAMIGVFYSMIVEIGDEPVVYAGLLVDAEELLNDLGKAGWTVEPAPAGVYPLTLAENVYAEAPAIRIDSDGGRVEPLTLASAGSA